jgi:hypothetical protein
MHLSRRLKILVASLVLLLVGIPLTISILPKNQDPRTKAAAGTIVSLIPKPGPASSIQKNVGDTVPVEIWLDPGPNAVTLLRLEIKFVTEKLETEDELFTLNTNSRFTTTFPPTVTNGTASIILTTGTDPNNSVRTKTLVGTLNFKAIAPTETSPTEITFGDKTQAYSVASGDSANVNVISNKNPAQITISGEAEPTIGPGTKLSFIVLLHGIGISGDTPNPTGNSFSNKNPKHPERELTAEVYDNNDELVSSGTGTITYVKTSDISEEVGTFKGTVILDSIVADGKYTIKVKSDRYLRKAFPGTITLAGNSDNILPQIELVAGDTNNDNVIDILDYNALRDCGYGALNPLPITNSSADYNKNACKDIHEPRINIDLEDNGIVNSYDYNLFIRELSVQSGD